MCIRDSWNAAWVKYDENTTGADGVYYYNVGDKVVKTSQTKQDLPKLFTGLTVSDDAVFYDTNGKEIKLQDIVAEACAVQAKNVSFEKAAELTGWVAVTEVTE